MNNVLTKNKTELRQVYSLCEKIGMRLDLPVEEMMGYPVPVISWDLNNVGGNYKEKSMSGTISFEEFLKKFAEFATQPAPLKVGEYTAAFKDNGVQVGCTFVDKETVKAIYERLFSK